MKTLILTCNTGGGHNSCAKSIKEYYDLLDSECDISDALQFISDRFSRLISNGHTFIYRHLPRLFDSGYRVAERREQRIFSKNSLTVSILKTGCRRLYDYITENEYTHVICTHVFAGLMLTHAKRKYPLNVKSALVSTDYAVTPSTRMSDVDYYFIPDEGLIGDFCNASLPKDKIIPCGMPISQRYYHPTDKLWAKTKRGLKQQKTHVLIMCGSMGCGPVEDILRLLYVLCGDGCQITAVCGSNANLKKRLTEECGHLPDVHVIGYEHDVPTLLCSADLFITKPGGLSTSEAAAVRLPMVFIDAVSGCEGYNLRFFTERGCARAAKTAEQAVEECLSLINSPTELEAMSSAFPHAPPNAAEVIFNSLNS